MRAGFALICRCPEGGRVEPWGMNRGNRKGCDFGYALAANSCEGVRRVDACTVTAFGAITTFAVPNPNGHLATPSVFSGPAVLQVAPLDCIAQPTLASYF